MDSVHSSPELPEEMIEEEILLRASVKSLLRFRSVSKAWRSLIDNERLVEKHLVQNSKRRSSIVFNHHSSFVPLSFPSYSPDSQPSIAPFPLNLPPDDQARCYVAGHHNGLLCILKARPGGKKCFLLWNPATRISVQLPDIDVDVWKSKLGFGWDEHAGAYKVFVRVPDDRRYYNEDDGGDHDGRTARIYSSETNSWQGAEHGSDSFITKVGVFARGRIYWLMRSGRIEYLDLRNEVFGETTIDHPCKIGVDGSCFWFWGRRGSLCMVHDTNYHTKRSVWVMKEEENSGWVEDEGLVCEIGMCVHGVFGAFSYVETLVSPPPLLLLPLTQESNLN